MFDFFNYIVEFFSNVWNFFGNMIDSIINVLSVLVSMVQLPGQLVGFIPGIISSCAVIVGAVGITKLIVGWGNA